MRLAAAVLLLCVACSGPAPDTRLAAGAALRSPAPTATPTRIPSVTLRASAPATPCGTDSTTGVPGKWRASSVTLVADRGLATAPSIATISGLCLEPDATWRYGNASGKWSTTTIVADDWKRWGIPAQTGLTQKLVLSDWAGGPADGPIGAADITLVTRVGPPDYAAPGTLSIIFSR